MLKSRLVHGIIAAGFLLSVSPGIGQDTPAPISPAPVAAAPPPPTPTPVPDVLTSVPEPGSTPPAAVTPAPGTPPPITPPPKREDEPSAVTSSSSFQWSEAGAPAF